MPPCLTPYIDREALLFHLNFYSSGQPEDDPVIAARRHLRLYPLYFYLDI